MTAIIINSKTISPHIAYGLQLNEHSLIKQLENHQLCTSAADVYKDNPSILISDTTEALECLCDLLTKVIGWVFFCIHIHTMQLFCDYIMAYKELYTCSFIPANMNASKVNNPQGHNH